MLLLSEGRQLVKCSLAGAFQWKVQKYRQKNKGSLGSFLNLGRESRKKSAQMMTERKPKSCPFMYMCSCTF